MKTKYRTELSVVGCLEGISLTYVNAERLYKEGLSLEKNASPTSVFLYAVAIEELAKATLLAAEAFRLIDGERVGWVGFWHFFYSHTLKQTGLVEVIRIFKKAELQELKKITTDNGTVTQRIVWLEKYIKIGETIIEDMKKNKSQEMAKWERIYVDHKNGRWISPTDQNKSPHFFNRKNVEYYLEAIRKIRKELLDTQQVRS